jgi:hypothetical protein
MKPRRELEDSLSVRRSDQSEFAKVAEERHRAFLVKVGPTDLNNQVDAKNSL